MLIAIVGPTASGKSEIADIVAEKLACEIVSVDAMQVYRGMDIGTAKTPVDKRRRSLHMVDVCEVSHTYSVIEYQQAARKCIDELLKKDQTAVLCGGTGLYLDAILDDINFAEKSFDETRRKDYLKRAQTEDGIAGLYNELQQRDNASAHLIHPHNTKRVIRALELCDVGQSWADRAGGLHKHPEYYPAHIWGLNWPRELLYERINMRVDAMFAEGLVDEVKQLCKAGLETSTTARQAIGYKEILDFLQGSISLDEAKQVIAKNTRHYAKRQISWFKRDERVHWLDMQELSCEQAAQLIVDDYMKCIG